MREPRFEGLGRWGAAALIAIWFALVLVAAAGEARAEASAEETGRGSDALVRGEAAPAAEPGATRRGDFGADGLRGRAEAGGGERLDRVGARRRLRALRRALPDFSRTERRRLLLHARNLPAEERRALRTKLLAAETMSEAERARFKAELRQLIADGADDAARWRENAARWRKMPEAEREKMREQMRRFRRLPPEERKALLEEWAGPGSAAGEKGEP